MFSAGFILGLSGSLHCAGMCGPLCFILVGKDDKKNTWGLILYNLARILVYTLFGVLVGLLGESLAFTSYFPYVVFAVSILLFGVGVFALFKGNLLDRIPVSDKIMGTLRAWFKPFFAKRNWVGFVGMGVFNALIPCGLLYTALLSSLSFDKVWASAVFMFMFGLGTAPAMISSQYIAKFIKKESFKWLKYIMPILLIAMAFFLMYRSQEMIFTPSGTITECN